MALVLTDRDKRIQREGAAQSGAGDTLVPAGDTSGDSSVNGGGVRGSMPTDLRGRANLDRTDSEAVTVARFDVAADVGDQNGLPMVVPSSGGGSRVSGRESGTVMTSMRRLSCRGTKPAYAWRTPVSIVDMTTVLASTMPSIAILGRVVRDDRIAHSPGAAVPALPTAFGRNVGRTLLYPNDADVERAADNALELL